MMLEEFRRLKMVEEEKPKRKYKNEHCHDDGWLFHSKKERSRYIELKLLVKCGEVKYFLRQVPFHLDGGVKYIADFLIFWSNGEVTIEDVKGMVTKEFLTKKKLVEHKYSITIEIIK